MHRTLPLVLLAAALAVGGLPCPTSAGAALAYVPTPPVPGSSVCAAYFSDPLNGIGVMLPGPFALVQSGVSTPGIARFHFFYTRRLLRGDPARSDHTLGHATSSNLLDWTIVDTAAVAVRPHRLDALHVSAPTIVRAGEGWTMLYNAIDAQGRERIALARSLDLDHWVQEDRPALEPGDIPWAVRGSGASWRHPALLRDPFVMADPAVPGGWILYFVTVPATRPEGTVVGFARSRGDLRSWIVGPPLWVTFRRSLQFTGRDANPIVAAPHAFLRDGAWRLFTTVDHAGPAFFDTPGDPLVPPDSVFVVSNVVSPIDTATARWSQPQALQYAGTASTGLNFWQDTECLEVAPGVQVIAGVVPPVVGIGFSRMAEAPPPALFGSDCPILPATSPTLAEQPALGTPPALALEDAGVASPAVRLRVALPRAGSGTVAVYDVRGRSFRRLYQGGFMAGQTRLEWDARDDGGRAVPRGIYFLELRAAGARAAVRVAILR